MTGTALRPHVFRHVTSSACIVANSARWIHNTMVVLALREVTILM
jgi:hypothetical protein